LDSTMAKKDFSTESAVNALVSTGMKKNTAKVLIHLAIHKTTTSDEVERVFGLGQPGVSASIHDLDDRGWIRIKQVKGTGKGRPKHTYFLSKPFSSIIEEIEAWERARAAAILSNVSDLKSMAEESPQ